MCTRMSAIALLATVALVSCAIPENAIVPESLVEALATPEEDATAVMNAGVVTNADESIAHDGPADGHDEVVCAAGETLCDGSCQTGPCATPVLAEGSYSYTFQPNPVVLQPAPQVAGREEDYTAEANNYLQSQSEAQQQAITNAEQSSAFAFASHDASLAAATQRNAALRNEVEKLMNVAAAAAAKFHKATISHDGTVADVKKSQIEEKKQAHIVELAEATLKKEKDLWQKAKEHVTAMVQAEEQARYTLEFDGQEYQKAKAAAIRADNSLQESVHEDEEKEKFRKVAQEAVEKAAAEELKAVNAQAAPAAPAVAPAAANATATCSDCTTLPHVYLLAGGKCSDCSSWAARGECDQTEYKTFMHHYCAKSCGCPAPAAAGLTQTGMSMPTKA